MGVLVVRVCPVVVARLIRVMKYSTRKARRGRSPERSDSGDGSGTHELPLDGE